MTITAGLPEGWVMRSLSELGRWSGGGTPSKANRQFWENGTIPWVSPKDMKTERISDSEDHITSAAIERSSTRLVRKGAVLVVVRSGILRHSLPVAVADRDVTLNQDLKAVELSEGVEPDYVAWALRSSARDILHTCAKGGTTVQNIEMQRFLRYRIPVPPLEQQRRIVAEIEKQLTRLEAGVASLKRVQAALKRYRASVLKAACEGRLVPTEAELASRESRSYETANTLLARTLEERRTKWEGRGKYKEPVTPDLTGLEEIPEGWCWASAEQACSTVASGSTPKVDLLFSGSGEVPFIKVYNLTFGNALDFTIKPTFINRKTHQGHLGRSKAIPGDVLTNIVGPPLGKVSVVPNDFPEWNINQAIVVFRPTEALSNRLLAFWLRSEGILSRLSRTAKATAGQFNIQVTTCRKLALPLPPAAEQARIVGELERHMSVIDELESVISANALRATRLRQSVLHRAFSGGF